MPLNESKGNMYPWVTHTHTHLGGRCSHFCDYCYVGRGRFGRPPRYEGALRLLEKEFNVNYGKNKTIFMENCNDLFAFNVPHDWILRVLDHCRKYPDNTYVFQTKNPLRYFGFLAHDFFPRDIMLGTTIETNRKVSVMAHSLAPEPSLRKEGMARIARYPGRLIKTFVTIEPILDFDVDVMLTWINQISPTFVNIGADSKGTNLPEPTKEKVDALIKGIQDFKIEIRQKTNLNRLLSKVEQLEVSEKPPEYVPPKPRIKVIHEEIHYCDACIYCHEIHEGTRHEILCTRSGRQLPNMVIPIRMDPERPSGEIPDWCPLPDKKDEKRGTGAPVPTGPTGR